MFETPKRLQSAVPVPDAPVRIRKEPSDPADQDDELPPLEASEDEAEAEEDQEDVDEEAQEDVDEEDQEDQEAVDEEDQEAVDEEDHKDQQEDLLSNIVAFLKAPNTIPIAVLVGWTAYLTVKTYCSCP
jgi:hypothetical protein